MEDPPEFGSGKSIGDEMFVARSRDIRMLRCENTHGSIHILMSFLSLKVSFNRAGGFARSPSSILHKFRFLILCASHFLSSRIV